MIYTEAYTLRGHLLIATAGLRNSMFRRSVILLCAHSPAGAMGLIVNRPIHHRELWSLLPNPEATPPSKRISEPLYLGGPAESERAFTLHSQDYSTPQETLPVAQGLAMTTGEHILGDIGRGVGPKHRLVALGYAGWGPGQLERELRENAWHTVIAQQDLVFCKANESKWRKAIAAIGIDAALLPGLSARHGHA